MKLEMIIKVKKVEKHCYDESQCESAIYAKSDKRPGYRWYVGYGSDYLPASKADLDNIEPYSPGYHDIEGTIERWEGKIVRMYRK